MIDVVTFSKLIVVGLLLLSTLKTTIVTSTEPSSSSSTSSTTTTVTTTTTNDSSSSAEDKDTEHHQQQHQQLHKECGLYLAPSTIPGAGMGMFAGNKQYNIGDLVTAGDLVVPVFELDWHNGKVENIHTSFSGVFATILF